jgi:hypothetical protein
MILFMVDVMRLGEEDIQALMRRSERLEGE